MNGHREQGASLLLPPPPPSDRPSSPPPPPPEELGYPPPPPRQIPQPRKEALSIEEILRKKKNADEAAAKPKFLSKAQREKIALEKRHKEVEAQRQQVQIKRELQHNGTNGTSRVAAVPQKENPRPAAPAIPTGPRAMRQSKLANGSHDMPPPRVPLETTKPLQENGKALQKNAKPSQEDAAAALIRQRYMGADQNKSNFSAGKKRKRTTEKKFNFDWNNEEDTSPDYNPLYQKPAEANFFGRGRLGGFADDENDEQARKYARALEERDHEAGSARAREMLEMEQRRKEEAGRNGIEKHWSEKKLENMRERDFRIMKEDYQIQIRSGSSGGTVINPMRSWQESGLPKQMLDVVASVGYDEPSAIQRAAIPIALKARDIIGVAVTGSGKTAAFLLPLLVYISDLPRLNETTKNDGPFAIILAPTRELAQQIEIEAKKFSNHLGFTCVSIVGGHSIEEQAYNMREGAEIVIATPGRLVDCIERRVLVLSQCCYVIMDEADRMIDLGFEEPVNKILDALPVTNEKPDTEDAENPAAMSQILGGTHRYRQTMMYTATMPSAIERIARKYLRRPAIVTIGNVGEAVETVEQRVEFITGEDKRKKRLHELLAMRDAFPPPIIVFVNIKRNADAIARDVKQHGFNAQVLHGGKSQVQREEALASVRKGESEVLVATDLAGRGIDVPDVSLVVNFNMATNIESYTHRVGRTGRAGKSGVAITFLGNEDSDVMYDLRQMLQKSSISRVPEELRKHEAAQQKSVRGGGSGGGGGGGKKMEESSGFGGKGGW